MKVVMLEPGKYAREMEIGDDLKAMQQAVGGYIEASYPFPEPVAVIGNDEAVLQGLTPNRRFGDGVLLFGPCFICGLGEENFTGLSGELCRKYKEQYYQPEIFFWKNGEIESVKVTEKKWNVLSAFFQSGKPEKEARKQDREF